MTSIGTTKEDAIRRLRAVGKVLRSTDCKCGLQSNQTMLETIEGTLAALDAAATQIEMMRKHHDEGLETDSLIASCGCMTKTNEVRFHKPGCKYRLICERNDARKTPREGGTTNCVKCGVEIPQSALCAECWSKSAFPASPGSGEAMREVDKIERIVAEGISNGDHPKTIAMKLASPSPQREELRTLTPRGIMEWTKLSEESLAKDPRKIRSALAHPLHPTAAQDAWFLFNETVRGKTDNYGPFTNAHWQAANAMQAELIRLRNPPLTSGEKVT